VHAEHLPAELMPVGHAVNRLLERVEEALLRERTLTADAAHELRTPLAALRAQAQVALRARADDERSSALRELIGGVDRATRLVESVLALARLDGRALDRAALPPVALDEVARQVAADLRAAADARALQFELEVPPLSLRADPDSLPVALRNLCDNALRHAAARVRIEARDCGEDIVVAVRDDGPGIAPAQRERAFDRFYRGTSEGSGAGLGLALVKRVADMHGGRVRFGEGLDGRGVGVELVLPRGAPTA
jgi:two-component system sensor histidine kinase QseC